MLSCPRCMKEVPAGVRFCGFCRKKRPDAPERARPLSGLSEGAACARCGFRNAPAFRCCVQCGAWLDLASEESATEPDENATERGGSAADAGGTVPRKAGSRAERSRDPARLLRLLPDGGVEERRLGEPHLTIARDGGDPKAALRVPDDTFLSHRHAEVVRRDGRYWLRDLDSTNGTFIRIRGECELRPGDQILIGGSLFKFVV